MKSRNYYTILGVNKNASLVDIKNQHRKLALQFHPDKTGHLTPDAKIKSADTFRNIQEAYECLSDPLKRQDHDDSLPLTYVYKENILDWLQQFAPHLLTTELPEDEDDLLGIFYILENLNPKVISDEDFKLLIYKGSPITARLISDLKKNQPHLITNENLKFIIRELNCSTTDRTSYCLRYLNKALAQPMTDEIFKLLARNASYELCETLRKIYETNRQLITEKTLKLLTRNVHLYGPALTILNARELAGLYLLEEQITTLKAQADKLKKANPSSVRAKALEELKNPLTALIDKTLSDIISSRLNLEEAWLLIRSTETLVSKALDQTLTSNSIAFFERITEPFKTSWDWRVILGAIIGLCLGLIIGTVTMGVGAPLGAIAGAYAGGIIAGVSLGTGVGFWRTRTQDPLRQIKNQAETIVGLEPELDNSQTPSNRQP